MSDYKNIYGLSFYIKNELFDFDTVWYRMSGGSDFTDKEAKYVKIYIIISGNMTLTVGENDYFLDKSRIAVLPPKIPHSIKNINHCDRIVVTLKIKDKAITDKMKNNGKIVYTPGKFINTFTEFIDKCLYEKPQGYLSAAEAQIVCFIFELFKLLSIPINDTFTRCQANENERKIRLAISFIMENNSSKISVSDVASYVGVSTRHLNRLFLRHDGKTASKVIRIYKINYIKSILNNTKLPLSEIAYKSGFSTEYSLIRFFKRETGITPGKYRNSNV